jgi:uncharacterized protein (TIGR02099 family)
LKNFFKKISRVFAYLFAVSIILAATFVSVSQLFNPFLNEHLPQFEKMVSNELNMPVKIQEATISWDVYIPELTFHKVAILDANKEKTLLQIAAIKVHLSFLKSLWQRAVVLSYIKIKGVTLNLQQIDATTLGLENFGKFVLPVGAGTDSNSEANPIINRILKIPAFIVDTIDVNYFPLVGPKYAFTIYKLGLHNNKTKHVLKGHASLHQTIPTSLDIEFAWKGDLAKFSEKSAKAFIHLEGVLLPQWLEKFNWHGLKILAGTGSAKIWALWSHNLLKDVQTELQIYQLKIYSTSFKKTTFITRFSGRFEWLRENAAYILQGQDIILAFPQHLWPTTKFYLKIPSNNELALNFHPAFPPSLTIAELQPPKISSWGLQITAFPQDLSPLDIVLRAGYVDLADLSKLIYELQLLPNEFLQPLSNLKLKGEIKDLAVEIADTFDFLNNKITATFDNIATNPYQNFPGFKNLTGKIVWDDHTGDLTLNTKHLAITYPNLWDKPLYFNSLSGNFALDRDDTDSLKIETDKLQFKSAIIADTAFSLKVPYEGSPVIDVTSNFSMVDTIVLKDYLNLKIFHPEFRQWLSNAFLHGTITKGQLILQGSLNAFPFEKPNTGKFLLNMQVADLEFKFAPSWPSLFKTKGTINFNGPDLAIAVQDTQMLNTPIANAKATLALGTDVTSILSVSIPKIQGSFANALQIIHASPLESKLGAGLKPLTIEGPLTLALNLTIPLKSPENTQVVGSGKSNNANVYLLERKIALQNIAGSFNFTEKSVTSEKLLGTFNAKPLTLQFTTTQTAATNPIIEATIQSEISVPYLQTLLNNKIFEDYVTGSTNFNLTLAINPPRTTVTLTTDLKGIAIKLPEPFGKTANLETPSTIAAVLQPATPLSVDFNLGAGIAGTTLFKNRNENFEFSSGIITLGGGKPPSPTNPGLTITGSLDLLDATAFQSVNKSASQFEWPQFLRLIDLKIKSIKGIPQKLSNTRIQLQHTKDNWLVDLNSKEVVGLIQIPQDRALPIDAKFQRMNLDLAQTQTSRTKFTVADVPPIRFVTNDLSYGGKSFGRVIFNVKPVNNKLIIETLKVDNNYFNLNANGEWFTQRTRLIGSMTVKNIANFMQYYSRTVSSLVGSSGTLTFDLNWAGSPLEPNLSGMAGAASIKLTQGQIINLDKATSAKMGFGRILNFLSIESLWKRLSLNFKDLFDKGFPFDSLTGTFTLKDGNAFTDNSRLESSIARIELAGRIGLAAKDYDATLSVTPFVTASIPVVAAIAVNPIVGVAAWAVEKVASQAVSNVTTHRYSITGPWVNPIWKEKK